MRAYKFNPCPKGFVLVDGLCVPDESQQRPPPTMPSPTPPTPPKPPTPPSPVDPDVIIDTVKDLDVAGLIAIATGIGVDLTKKEIQQILAGGSAEGISYNPSTGEVSVDPASVEIELPELRGDVDEISNMDARQLTEWYRENLDTASQAELDAYYDRLNQLTDIATGVGGDETDPFIDEGDEGGIELPEIDDGVADIMQMDANELGDWYRENVDTASQAELDAYQDRINQLTDIALGGDETEGLVDVPIDTPGVGLSKEQMEALSPEDFRALGERGGLSTQEIIDYNTIVIERAQVANPTIRIMNEMTGQLEPYSQAQIEAMTNEQLNFVLSTMSDEELQIVLQVHPDFLQGLDNAIVTQMQYDDLIAQAVEQGATDAEIEAMTDAFAEGGVDAMAGAVDLPLTVLAGGAVGLAWLSGDSETKKEIAKDAGKTQSWFDANVVEPAEGVISGTAKALGEGFKETADILTGKINPFTGKKNKRVSREPVGGVKPSEPRPKPKSDKGATDSDNFL